MPSGKPTLEKSISEGLYPGEKIHSGVVCEGLYIVGGTPHQRKETVRERTRSNEELLWTHHNPYSHHFCIIQGVDEVNELRTLSLGRRLGRRDLLLGFLSFVCFSQFYFILL